MTSTVHVPLGVTPQHLLPSSSASWRLYLAVDFPLLPPQASSRPGHQQGGAAAGKTQQPPPLLPQKELTDEFRELRATVERMGLMKANHGFFLLYLLHILLLDVAAWLTLWVFGTSFVPFLLCAVLLSTVQVRAPGWSRAQLRSAFLGKALCTPGEAEVPSLMGRAEGLRGSRCRERAHVPWSLAVLCSFTAGPPSSLSLPLQLFLLGLPSSCSGSAIAQVCREPRFWSISKAGLPPRHKTAQHANGAWAPVLGCLSPFAEFVTFCPSLEFGGSGHRRPQLSRARGTDGRGRESAIPQLSYEPVGCSQLSPFLPRPRPAGCSTTSGTCLSSAPPPGTTCCITS